MWYYIFCCYAGVVQWLESQPSKLVVWVRFPSPAPSECLGTQTRIGALFFGFYSRAKAAFVFCICFIISVLSD